MGPCLKIVIRVSRTSEVAGIWSVVGYGISRKIPPRARILAVAWLLVAPGVALIRLLLSQFLLILRLLAEIRHSWLGLSCSDLVNNLQ